MSAKKTTATTTQATDVQPAEQLGAGLDRHGKALAALSELKHKAAKRARKADPDEDDEQAAAREDSDEVAAAADSIVLAQADMGAIGELGATATDAAGATSGAASGATSTAAQSAGAAAGSGGTSAVAAGGAGAGAAGAGAVAAETAVVASGIGLAPVVGASALGVAGVAAAGGGGGGGDAAAPVAPAAPVPAVLSSAAVTLDETDAPLTTGGTLTISDADSPATFVAQTATAGVYGSFSIDAAGAWSFTANSALDNLAAGQSVSDTFTVTSADGTTTTVKVTINGTNDAAVLSSAVVALDETNAPLTTGGTLTNSDVDNPATFVAQTATAGVNGSFSVDAAGVWSYTASSAFDLLNVGQSVSDSFTVTSTDGTTTTVQVTINGTDDVAVLSAGVVALTQTNVPLATSGQLALTDADNAVAGTATFVAQNGTAGVSGKFSVDAAGAWSYTADKAFDNLQVGESVSDTFTVSTTDGQTTTVKVTIDGIDDDPKLEAAEVVLDETDAPLTTGGQLALIDVDDDVVVGSAVFVAQTGTAGVHGSFSIDTEGVWSYTANEAFDHLNVGESVTDHFDVATTDGKTTTVDVIINGTLDVPVITGTITGEVIEAGGILDGIPGTPTATGSLSTTLGFTAVDVPAASSGGFGTFTMSTAGEWIYTLDNANAAVQALNAGETLNDSFTVSTAGGGAQQEVAIVINGSTDVMIVSVAQAIDLLAQDPAASYALSDAPANLLAAPAAVTDVAHAVSMRATEPVSVADHDALAALNANLEYGLSDAAFLLLAAPTTVSGATAIDLNPAVTVDSAASVADANALLALNVGTVYGLSDTSANLAAAAAAVSGAVFVDVQDYVGVADAAALLALNPATTYTLADSVQNLLSPDNAAAVGAAAQVLAAEPVPAADALALLALNPLTSYDLADTVANLLANPEVAAGASSVTANAAAVADVAALLFSLPEAFYSLSDTPANLLAALPDDTAGALSMTATEAVSVADHDALAALNANLEYGLSDAAAQLLAAPATVSGATAIGLNPAVTVDAAVTVADANALLAQNAGTVYGLSDMSANLLAQTATLSAATFVDVQDYVNLADATALLQFNPNTSYYLADTAQNLSSPDNAATVGAAAQVLVAEPVSVADALALLALNPFTSYDLADTVANLLANPELAAGASFVEASAATLAEVATLLASLPEASYSLSDTPANLLAAPAADVANALSVTATEAVSVADHDALALLNANLAYGLSDAAFLLLAAPATVSGATAIGLNPAVDVTVAVSVADANALLALNADTTYGLSDLSANLLAATATLGAATFVDVQDYVGVADATALLQFNAQTTCYLAESAPNLLLPENAATVGAAAQVLVADPVSVADTLALLALNPFTSYDLVDTATNVLANPDLAVAATSVDASAATVAQADALLLSVPEAFYSVSDTAGNLAAAFSTASLNLPLVDDVPSVDVTGLGGVLVLDADQFGNFLSGVTLLAADDTIAVDGADVLANLGTLDPFGGDPLGALTLGGAQNGSYVVDMGSSGVAEVLMEGTGQHQIAAGATIETFIVGATSTGGSSISGLSINDRIDVGASGLGTNVATAPEVDIVGEWNFSGGTLTWFDEVHAQVETLALQLATGSNLELANNGNRFTVI